ncbi:HI1450 family dsDNA-mimic protein [Vibrio amylolyticus]|uniref:HI1450 family dsDNA-mimic protein n=1 Tax=Vibrio amylolyticus TaxID=2847292 RepID=UPI00354EE872
MSDENQVSEEHENLISYDDAIDVAYDIFLEMAPDNLEPADVIIFTAQFEDRGAAELVEMGDDWAGHVGFKVDKEIYAEIRIGLVNEEDDVLDDVFARMLVSRDPDHKFCHMLWKRD